MPEIERDSGALYFRASGSGPEAVVLLHDYFGTHRGWTSLQSQLSRYFLALAPDLRGHGRSRLGNGGLSIAEMAGDTVAMLDHLDVERAHMIGVSHGAVIAMHLARCMSERVESIVLTSVPDLGDPEIIEYGRQYATTVFPRLEPELERTHGAGQPGYPRDVLLRNFVDSLDVPPEDHLNALRLISRIECPVLVLCGDSDPVMGPGQALELMRRIPRAHLGILPSTGHLAHLESPTLYTEAVLDHLWRCRQARISNDS